MWPKTFVVEKNLANLVGEIREAIGDDPSNPQFIRTVHRFGYAFRDELPAAAVRRSTNRGGDVSFRLKWTGGRVTLEEGDHLIGRDPDAEIFLDSAGVSQQAIRGSGLRAAARQSKTSGARTERLSAISEWRA